MEKLRINVRYIDTHDNHGYMSIDVNGFSQPSIAIDFDTGNNVHFHRQLTELVHSAYTRGYHESERECKNKVNQLIDWAKSR